MCLTKMFVLWLILATFLVANKCNAATSVLTREAGIRRDLQSIHPSHSVFPTAFRFPNFLNRPKLNLVGDARTEVTELIIAGPERKKTGAVWFSQAFDISDGFFAEFAMSVSQIDNRGGEGFAFVVQKDGEYALGSGIDGMGYEGIGEGLAVEFDGTRDAYMEIPKDAATNDDGAHIAVRDALTPGARLRARHGISEGEHDTTIVPIPNLSQFTRPVDVRIEFNGKTNELSCWFNVAKTGKHLPEWTEGVKVKLSAPLGGASYYAGFTAATGHYSAAKFAVTKWRFGVSPTKFQGCVAGFTGHECSVTDEEAQRECPRRETCLGCVKNVYNCVWCSEGKNIQKGGECVVGTAEALAECSSYSAEEAACSSGLALIWLWISLGVFTVVFCFGFVMVRTLPRAQAYRAVSLLVALGIGAMLGMILSYVVAAALVEISTAPVFSLAFGVFFFYLGGVVALEVLKMRSEGGRWTWDQIASAIAVVWIVFAGVLCFLLDKKLVMWLPELIKVVLFAMLAAALTFCVVFSTIDLVNELYERCARRTTSTPGLAEILDTEARGRMFSSEKGRFFKVAQSKARYALLILASILSGFYFGLIFGLMRIEEEEVYRAALMLRQESVYTFPAGALVGGLSGLLLQLVSGPSGQSEGEVDRIMKEAKDDF